LKFYIGMHLPYLAHNFKYSFISVNVLRKRKSDFIVNNWIMDSGAFTEISTYGRYRHSPLEYANLIERWSVCGNLELAVAQDYMCEPFILNKTGLSVAEHQRLTIERYIALINMTPFPIMPVLQGYAPADYLRHIEAYGDLLSNGMRVGVGSVCKRNSRPSEIVAVLEPIKKLRPDLKLHGFGLKTTALTNNYIASLIFSADSMAWSYAARRQHHNPNGLQEARNFEQRIFNTSGTKAHQHIMQLELGEVCNYTTI
jgi:hypothetical protein